MRASRWSRSHVRLLLGVAVATGAVSALPGVGVAQSAASPSPSASVSPLPSAAPSVAPGLPASDPRSFAWYDLVTTGAGKELHVGRFDGRTWAPLVSEDSIQASGPAYGRVLAATTRGPGSDAWLIDAGTGESQLLRRTTRRIRALALDPNGGAWWWVTTNPKGASILVRQPVVFGRASATMAGPRDVSLSFLTPGPGRVAWWGLDGRGRMFATIVNGDGTAIKVDPIAGDVVGFLGDELISYAGTGSELGYPLVAFDPATKTTREIVPAGASFAMIGTDATGASVLIAQVPDETGTWRYAAIGADGQVTLLDAGAPADRWMSRSNPYQGSSTPGFLPLTPTGGFGGIDMATDWVLVPLDGGPTAGPVLPAASTAP